MRTHEMWAVVVTDPGAPEVMELQKVARPEPGPHELLVRVRSAGVNRADLLQRAGRYPAPPGWPADILGLEFAGTVEAVGPECRLRREGDRVMGIVGGGGYAEFVTVHEETVLSVPGDLDLTTAGAIPEVFVTAYDALFLQCGLKAGETVLIHAVGSGVGTAAVQLARTEGATTVGTSRTPEKLALAGELGLDHGLETGGTEARAWPAKVRALTEDRGVDVVLDLVGGPYLEGNATVLADGARWIVVGVSGGSVGTIDLRALMRRRASLIGTVLRARPLEDKIALAAAFEEDVSPRLALGGAAPVVDRVYAMSQVVDAHRRMEANLNFGKILLTWDD